jgi:hypothetical protein
VLAAYRAGAQLSWRRFAAAAEAAGAERRTLIVLAEAVFAYIDELSAASAEGYAREQSALAGERQARRRRLLELLARDPPPPRADLERAAENPAWPPPATLAALVFAAEGSQGAAGRLPPDVLLAPLAGRACALVPDAGAPGRRAALEGAVRGVPAGLGPTVPWPEAARSLARAALALDLAVREGERGEDLFVVAEDHMLDLLLTRDPHLSDDLARARLAPLERLGPGPRERLTRTLRAWLAHSGEVRAAAAELGVHPQSVRYRLGRLREIFGPDLEDPDVRLELALALRVDDRGRTRPAS